METAGKLLQLKREYSKFPKFKVNIQNSIDFQNASKKSTWNFYKIEFLKATKNVTSKHLCDTAAKYFI